MRFTTFIFILVAIATVVCAVSAETNANRFARGLPPLPPVRRGTPVAAAKRGSPSGTPPPMCSTGTAQCCNSTGHSSDGGLIGLLLGLLGLNILDDILIGITCSLINPLLGASSCSHQAVCCTDNGYNGVVAVGCSPINL